MPSPASVVLLGKGDLSIQIAEWFHASEAHTLAAIIPVTPEPVWTGSLATWARERGVPVVDSGHWRDLPGEGYDLGFSCFYDKILKPEFLSRFGRILNLHNGPLPRYRGVSPINWALKNGESEHGVTIHEITPGIDDGPIVSQVRFSIYASDTPGEGDEVGDVYRRALAYGWTLFAQTLPILDRIDATPQDESLALYYHGRQNAELGDRRYFTRAETAAR